jgi:hypothetical protein
MSVTKVKAVHKHLLQLLAAVATPVGGLRNAPHQIIEHFSFFQQC